MKKFLAIVLCYLLAAAPALAVSDNVQFDNRATYSAATTAKTATAAGTGVFFSICGSATKTVRVTRLVISGTVATAAVYADVQVQKRSTATSGGTPVALTRVPHDSNLPGTAAASYYTALGTGGTLVGNVVSRTVFMPITGTPALMPPPLEINLGDQEPDALVLRGVAQCATASFGTTTTNAPTLTVEVTWTEE